jgi:hypothetical protein
MTDEELAADLDELLSTIKDDPDDQEPETPLKRSPVVTTLASTVPALASTPVASTSAPITSYTFPEVISNAVTLRALADAELHAKLDDLCHAKRLGARETYSAIREEVCAIAIAMNMQGLRAPRFRRMRKVTPLGAAALDEQLLSNDRKMIDLHWLHCHGERREVHDPDFRKLLATADFDFTLASEFCSRKWKTESRVVNILVLTDFEQWQLSALVASGVHKQAAHLEMAAKGVEKRLREIATARTQLRAQVVPLTALWKASEICKGMTATDRLVGQFYSWQLGEKPLAKSTLSKKLKLLEELLPGSPLSPASP